MSQHDYNIANGGGAAVRADINSALSAIKSQNSGSSAPSATAPFMPWYDTATDALKFRNAADTGWESAVHAMVGAGGMSFRNRIINGDMRIDQRNAGASVTPTDGQYTVDRWRAGASAASKFSVQRSTTAPAGFANSMLITSLSAYSVISTDNFEMFQYIEGFNVADLGWGTANAQSITVSFWVRSSLTGAFGGTVTNGAFSRSYPFSYTISAANTWEYKTVTILGDTSGTWATDNSTGLVLCIGLGAGTTRSGSAGSWSGSALYNATGATSIVGTNGATFYITGVQLEAGSVATPFERRPYGTELALCQRYYEKSYNQDAAPGTVTSVGAISYRVANNDCLYSFRTKVEKRTTATYTIFNPVTGTAGEARNLDASVNYAVSGAYASASGLTLTMSGASGAHIQFQYAASAEL